MIILKSSQDNKYLLIANYVLGSVLSAANT